MYTGRQQVGTGRTWGPDACSNQVSLGRVPVRSSQWVQKLFEEQGTKDLKPLARIFFTPWTLYDHVHMHTHVHICGA